ncbi:2TM domain-containing protein [Scytonema hofmannii FACHB-248]|uniref:2TM domain-containing protein n=1 Tax=Scytonema hofmannii FACHB-248 TaxID=1842502 RepID=A0ABR8H1Z1_9CYAN|nr:MULTISPECIES: 2TM domain-containing protein [Nostocales]MBD2609539.1 2TM domain-containing protein [Scytonema hofmannii FACHB-248]
MSNSYRSEDVQQILQLAMTQKAEGRDFSRQELLEMAADLGISQEAIAEAEKQLIHQSEKQRAKQVLSNMSNSRRRKFKTHLFLYLIINTFLVVIDVMTDGKLNWAYWPILGWGLGLAFDAFDTFQGSNDER